MPRDGATTFGDLVDRLEDLRVTCEKCGRAGRYRLDRLIAEHGRDAKIPDWPCNDLDASERFYGALATAIGITDDTSLLNTARKQRGWAVEVK